MYTIYFLFRRSRDLPNITSSILMIVSSVICSLFVFVFAMPQADWLCCLLSAIQIFLMSSVYWLDMRLSHIEHHVNVCLKRDGFLTSSLYAVEAADSRNKVFFDTPSSSKQVNFSAALLSPLPMDQLEAACAENGMGEYYCQIDSRSAADHVIRSSAAGRVTVVAWDRYDMSPILGDADCVFMPSGSDSRGYTSVIHYDNTLYSGASNACGAFFDLAPVIIKRIGRYYGYVLGVAMIAQIIHMCVSVTFCDMLASAVSFCCLLFLEMVLTVLALRRLEMPISKV